LQKKAYERILKETLARYRNQKSIRYKKDNLLDPTHKRRIGYSDYFDSSKKTTIRKKIDQKLAKQIKLPVSSNLFWLLILQNQQKPHRLIRWGFFNGNS
jgi:hypothetical protein